MTMVWIIVKKVRRLHLQTVDVQSLHTGNQYQIGANADTVNLWLERLRTKAVDKESVRQQVDILKKLCLHPEVLELYIRNNANNKNDREDTSTSSFRKAANRQLSLETYVCLE